MNGISISDTPPNALNILIVGAGCAGPVLALLLQKTNPNHTITIIERFSSLRTGGQQLDLKAQGLAVARNLGLLGTLKEVCVKETGSTFVDRRGNSLMRFGVSAANEKRRQGATLTNEYEIMRGDLVKVFYDASLAEKKRLDDLAGGDRKGGLTYKFGTTITALEQHKHGVHVTFSTGQTSDFDLVVAADGQNSRTRRMAFGEDVNAAAFKTIGIQAAYFDIPRLASDNNDAHMYFGPGGRTLMTRTGNRDMMQVYFFLMKDSARHEQLKTVHKMPQAQQKQEWSDIYKGAGYDCERFLRGLEDTNDFYAHEIGQVRMPHHYAGRVVLLGDAGYCPSPFSGMGTTLSLVGSHILAGELAKHADDVDGALAAYDEMIKQPLKEYQNAITPSDMEYWPSSKITIGIFCWAMWTASVLRIDKLAMWIGGFFRNDTKEAYEIPKYPHLGLGAE